MTDRLIDPLSRQLSRFDHRLAGQLHACAALHGRVAQLAVSFPVLFFALATGYGPAPARHKAGRLAADGKAIAEVAAPIGLPLSFRRLPPEACVGLLIEVPWSKDASRRFGSLVPRDPAQAAAWLKAISIAALACDEPFAVWLACQDLFRGKRVEIEQAALALAVFAWHSRHTAEADILRPAVPWTADLSLESALARLCGWLIQHRRLSRKPPQEPRPAHSLAGWAPHLTYEGLEFVPLVTRNDLEAEGTAMSNCVGSYHEQVVYGQVMLFSVRRNGERVATVEVGPASTRQRIVVQEMKAKGNRDCAPEVVDIAERWARLASRAQARASGPRPPRRETNLPPSSPNGEEGWFRRMPAPYRAARPLPKRVCAKDASLYSLKSGAKAAYHCAALACHDGLHFDAPAAAFRGVPVTTKKTRRRAASRTAKFLSL